MKSNTCEAGHVAYSRLDEEPSPTTIGRPLTSRESIVVSPETLEPVEPCETWELLVTCDYTIKEYWNKPEETRKAFVPINGRTYYRMGDFVS